MDIKRHYRPTKVKKYEARWYVEGRLKCRFFATEQERDRAYRKHIERHLADFLGAMGDRQVHEVGFQEIADYILGLPHQPVTKRHYRRDIKGAYAWWIDQGWAVDNPVKKVRTPPTAFELTQRQYLYRRSEALKRAGLLVEADDIARENRKRQKQGKPPLDLQPACPPKNCFRHSFVTYHVALHRDPGKTALIVSHRDQDCLYRHYLGVATKEDARRYFRIRPR